MKALSNVYPDYDWQFTERTVTVSSNDILKDYLTQLFVKDDSTLLEDYNHSNNLELQYFLPHHNLAFEINVNNPSFFFLKSSSSQCISIKKKGF